MNIQSLYPSSIDNLFGDLQNSMSLTLASYVSKVSTTIAVVEDISSIAVPCFFAFRTGEIIYVDAKNNSLRQLSNISRGETAQDHGEGEVMVMSVNAGILLKIKKAIVAIEETIGLHSASPTVASHLSSSKDNSASLLATADVLAASSQTSLSAAGTLLSNATAHQSNCVSEQSGVASIKTSSPRGTDHLGDYFSLPVGSVVWYGGGAAPTGWLSCDGSLVSQATYPSLYAVCPILPDVRGHLIMGLKNGAIYTHYFLGLHTPGVDSIEGIYWDYQNITASSELKHSFGLESVALIAASLPRHSHTVVAPDIWGASRTIGNGTKNYAAWMEEHTRTGYAGSGDVHYNFHLEGETWVQEYPGGSAGALHNNMQPSVVLKAIIKT